MTKQTVVVTIRMSQEEKRRLDHFATVFDTTKSEQVRAIINAGYEAIEHLVSQEADADIKR